ncbi:MAG: SCO family protein [Verrucomicrobiota bacterium]
MAIPAEPSSKTPAARSAVTRVPGGWLDDRDRRLIAWGLGGAIVLAITLGLLMAGLQRSTAVAQDPDAQTPVIAPDYPRQLANFSLTDQDGKPVMRRDLQGKIVVVDFIYTSCSLTCPYVNAQMEKIQRATAGRSDVRLLSLTLDPADDTVAVLARYAPDFEADSARWSFLTGDAAAIHDLVGTSFLPPDTTGQFSYMPGNFAHIQRMVLVDATGKVVSYYDGLSPGAADAVLARIQELGKTP